MSQQDGPQSEPKGEDNEELSRQFGTGPIFGGTTGAAFERIRKKTVILAGACIEQKDSAWDSRQQVIYQFLTLAQQTSYATIELASRGLVVPALALTRVRTEQLIVSSYLIHEEPQLGIEPFVKHMSVSSFLGIDDAFTDPVVREFLSKEVDYENAKLEAIKAMTEINPDFDADSGRFERKWTKLDLLSMAKKRDQLVIPLRSISSRLLLQSFYVTTYKTLSSVVHSDSLAISENFLGKIDFSVKTAPVHSPNLIWIGTTYAHIALFDILQVYESMLFLGVDCSDETHLLIAEWIALGRKLS